MNKSIWTAHWPRRRSYAAAIFAANGWRARVTEIAGFPVPWCCVNISRLEGPGSSRSRVDGAFARSIPALAAARG